MRFLGAGGKMGFGGGAKGTPQALYTWGNNNYGQLGLGSTAQQNSPQQVGSDEDWSFVSCGEYHIAALKTDGTLWTCGRNNNGQLGLGNTADQNTFQQVGSDTWSTISCGPYHIIGIKTDGTMYSWGSNNQGQLGLGNTTQYTSPQQIGSDSDWTFISSDSYTSHAINSSGELYGWGRNVSYNVGDGTATSPKTSPVRIGSDSDWIYVDNAYQSTSIIKTNGDLYAVGYNICIGTATTVTLADNSGDWTRSEWGYYHSIGIKDGKLYAFGYGPYGGLGLGGTVFSCSIAQIGSDTDWQYAEVVNSEASATEKSCAIKTNGELYTWGENFYGSLGLGDTSNRNTPTQVGSDTGWIQVSMGGYSTAAIKQV